MKIWIKYLIGIGLGAAVSLFIPEGDAGLKTMGDIAVILVQIGKYAVFPLVFFSFIISTFELRVEKKLLPVLGRFFLYLLCITVGLTLIGTVSGIFLPVQKPFVPGPNTPVVEGIPFLEILKQRVFPDNLLSVFTQAGFSLFPIIILAFLVGLNVDYEKQFTRPVVQFADGMSRIMYHINSLFVELFWIGMIALGAARVLALKNLKGGEAYLPLFLALAIDVLLAVFLILPLFLYYLNNRKNPFHWLYASLGPALAGLFTGDPYVALGVLTKHGRENMHVPRKFGTTVYTLGSIFSKAGTAMVAAVCMILLRKSTLGAQIPFLEYVWIFFASIAVSLFTSIVSAPFPQTGAYAAVAFLCLTYVQPNMTIDKYLDLGQIAPILIGAAVLVDVLVSSLIAFRIAQEMEFKEEIDVKRCI
ncbi:MAG: dicarboxylate/amino acid:cation symporter [Spirochaetales bacterium]|nr:dicarboxylate/amino acid:cation symporter [Spirochaetales bacterium]